MIKSKSQCLQCREVISNPICEHCYTKQVKLWMEESEIDVKTRNQVLKRIKSVNSKDFEYEDGLNCIFCGKETSLCSHCFFFRVFRILITSKISDGDIKMFLKIFNYRPHDEDYFDDEKETEEVRPERYRANSHYSNLYTSDESLDLEDY